MICFSCPKEQFHRLREKVVHICLCPVFRSKKNRGGGGDDDEDSDGSQSRGRSRKPRTKGSKKSRSSKSSKVVEDEDGLTAKQRRKVVSKALISSSEGSDSEGRKMRVSEDE